MTGSARDRRLRLLQAKKAEQLKDRLSAFDTGEFAQWPDFPEWLRDEFVKTRRTTAEPDSVLPESADDDEIRAWQAEFAARAGLDGRLYVLTGVDDFPWLYCAARDDRWAEEIGEVLGYGWTAIGAGKDRLVVFYEEEYEYQAFLVAPGHLRDDDGRLREL
ncbi:MULTISPECIES: hypothetical protein [Amycolatopsis]|uniref:SMI1/KNR4 family protein n=1 Tax=Amycolatopsis tucumanensis TaxID=401106 RepID=A0ABP7IP15_9PSEU|nr:hypothetical protein [Amycolatopsis tucumanensis]MCF6429198.1 hypothetical protein [Amycolatopsis tucumanensis]